MTDYAPGMRAVIRDEEWLIKKIETNSLGHQVLQCVGITPLVRNRDTIFLTDLEQIQIVDPASIQLIADSSPFFKRSLFLRRRDQGTKGRGSGSIDRFAGDQQKERFQLLVR